MSRTVGRISEALFAIAATLYPVLTAVVIFNVILRYGFGIGSIELEELQWHIYAAAFLLGLPEVFRQGLNIRVDFVWRNLSDKTKTRIEIAGLVLLILPFLAVFSYYAFYFFERSWRLGEVSPHSSGLPARFVIKSVLFIAFAGLFLQALATLLDRVAAMMAPRGQD
mgnify:CR=1 FL=1